MKLPAFSRWGAADDAKLEEFAARREEWVLRVDDVEGLRAYSEDVVARSIRSIARATLANTYIASIRDGHPSALEPIMAEIHTSYPGYSVNLNILGAATAIPVYGEVPPGVPINEPIPERDSFCRYAVASGGPVAVIDSLTDLIVCTSPYAEQVRSYLGAPVPVRTEQIGTVCIFKDEPRNLPWPAWEIARMSQWADDIGVVCEAHVDAWEAAA